MQSLRFLYRVHDFHFDRFEPGLELLKESRNLDADVLRDDLGLHLASQDLYLLELLIVLLKLVVDVAGK